MRGLKLYSLTFSTMKTRLGRKSKLLIFSAKFSENIAKYRPSSFLRYRLIYDAKMYVTLSPQMKKCQIRYSVFLLSLFFKLLINIAILKSCYIFPDTVSITQEQCNLRSGSIFVSLCK